ncbi:cation/multidrug efflux pump [Marinimicrobium alkaliphilum]|uniref:cation/multidrug efflux pump n=1 Tax=Marinimicrobium alkaliphilum TaxID=2202654 RepID=UPI000DB9C84E|nr:cation/multidrug efflux pump [Marinimicrobium alkaliphilum]
MIYSVLLIVILLVCAVIAFAGVRVLLRQPWVRGWVRGTAGLGLLAGALLVALVALALFGYRQPSPGAAIATLGFERVDEQHFRVTLVDTRAGEEHRFELHGDQWELDARLVQWVGSLERLGANPGYQLNQVSGRYYALAQDRTEQRTLYGFDQAGYGIDVWAWLERYPWLLPVLQARTASVSFVPMADGALYEVRVDTSGLEARGLNERARTLLAD